MVTCPQKGAKFGEFFLRKKGNLYKKFILKKRIITPPMKAKINKKLL